jgi:flagellar biosynthesis protein FliQ
MNRNTQRIVAALLVFAMIAGIVIAIFASAANALAL